MNFRDSHGKVRLSPIRQLLRDLRAPLTHAERLEQGKRFFKLQRKRECRKTGWRVFA